MYSQLTNKTQAVFFVFFLVAGAQAWAIGSTHAKVWGDAKPLFENKAFRFRTVKAKNLLVTGAKYAAPAAVAGAHFGVPLVAGAVALGAAAKHQAVSHQETEYEYKFRLEEKRTKGNRILVEMTPVKRSKLEAFLKLGLNNDPQYASLKMVTVPDTSAFNGSKRVKFVFKNLQRYGRVCDRWIFFEDKETDMVQIVGGLWDLMKKHRKDATKPKINLKDPEYVKTGIKGNITSWWNRSGGARIFGQHKRKCIRMDSEGNTESGITRTKYLSYFKNDESNHEMIESLQSKNKQHENMITQKEKIIEDQYQYIANYEDINQRQLRTINDLKARLAALTLKN